MLVILSPRSSSSRQIQEGEEPMHHNISLSVRLARSLILMFFFLLLLGSAVAQTASPAAGVAKVEKEMPALQTPATTPLSSTGKSEALPAENPIAPAVTSSSITSAPSVTNSTKATPANVAGDPKETTKAKADAPKAPQMPPQCKRTINADVVAMPQPIMLNRLGAAIPDGLIFALKS